jgi:hypothetical protein
MPVETITWLSLLLLPGALLQISDLHVDMNEGAMRCLSLQIRGATFGPFAAALEGMKRLRSHLGKMVYGVLGNHDTIRMVPDLEDMGIRVLLNECKPLSRGGENIYLAVIDDAHFYRVDNIEKAIRRAVLHGRETQNDAPKRSRCCKATSPLYRQLQTL